MRHTLILDSQDRDYDTFPDPNAYRLQLPRNYRNVVRARLLTAEIPATFYVFESSKGSTTMRFGIDGTYADVTIPDGNYTDATIGPAIVAALQNVFAGYTFTCTVDKVTMKSRIACTSNLDAILSIDGTGAENRTHWGLAYYLGYEAGVVRSGVGSIVSPRVVCLNPQTYVVVDIPELNNIDESGRSAFAKIPFDTNSFGYAFYSPTAEMPFVEFAPPIQKLSRLSVTLRFHDGTVLDFKGVEHSLTLEIETRTVPEDAMKLETVPLPPLKPRQKTIVVRAPPPPPPPPIYKKKWVYWILAILAASVGWWYFFHSEA